jgi:hypothetical protein
MHHGKGQIKDLYMLLGLKKERYIPVGQEKSCILLGLKKEPYILVGMEEQP